MNRPIAGADRHQRPAAVQLAANFILTNLAFSRDRKIKINVSVTGVQIYVRRQISRDFETNVTVTGFKPPLPGQRRPACGLYVDVAVSRLQFKLIEAAAGPDVAVPGGGSQLAVDRVEVLGAVSAVQIHFALQARDLDLAVPGPQVDPAFPRHLDDDVHAVIAEVDGQAMVRIAHVDLDRIAVLVFFDPDAAFTNLVTRRNHFGFDRILIPGANPDVGVGGLHTQVRPAGQVVRFRPFVSARRQARGETKD